MGFIRRLQALIFPKTSGDGSTSYDVVETRSTSYDVVAERRSAVRDLARYMCTSVITVRSDTTHDGLPAEVRMLSGCEGAEGAEAAARRD